MPDLKVLAAQLERISCRRIPQLSMEDRRCLDDAAAILRVRAERISKTESGRRARLERAERRADDAEAESATNHGG